MIIKSTKGILKNIRSSSNKYTTIEIVKYYSITYFVDSFDNRHMSKKINVMCLVLLIEVTKFSLNLNSFILI